MRALWFASDCLGWLFVEAAMIAHRLAGDDEGSRRFAIICPIGDALYSLGNSLYSLKP